MDLERMKARFGSAADARGYAQELNYAISHPEEEELDADQLAGARKELALIKQYLAECDEPL